MTYQVIVTCEHASNKIPKEYQNYFESNLAILETHCAYDIGAMSLYQAFIKTIECKHQTGEFSRLLVDLNRTVNHPKIFSHFTKNLPANIKKEILNKYYFPYVNKIKHWIEEALTENKKVLHISVHSFTPYLDQDNVIPLQALSGGKRAKGIRANDLAFLYDSKRYSEKIFCEQWREVLQEKIPELKIRMNYPYRGDSNGLTTFFRKYYLEQNYLGIELESNQRLFLVASPLTKLLYELLPAALKDVL